MGYSYASPNQHVADMNMAESSAKNRSDRVNSSGVEQNSNALPLGK
jgi:hypothetical protein